MLTRLWVIPVLLLLAPAPVLAQSDHYCERLAEQRILPRIKEANMHMRELVQKVEAHEQAYEDYMRMANKYQCFIISQINEELEALCIRLLSQHLYKLDTLMVEIDHLINNINSKSDDVSEVWYANGCSEGDTPSAVSTPPAVSSPPSSQGSEPAAQNQHCHGDWQQHLHAGSPGTKYWHRHVGGKCAIASVINP